MAPAMHGHSAACCSIPPIVSKGYEQKGKYETIGGLKTCKFDQCFPPERPMCKIVIGVLSTSLYRIT